MQPPVLTRTITTQANTSRTNTTSSEQPSPAVPRIDMLTPYQACVHLGIGPAALLALVNSGALPAYRFESAVRFRLCEVEALDLPAAA